MDSNLKAIFAIILAIMIAGSTPFEANDLVDLYRAGFWDGEYIESGGVSYEIKDDGYLHRDKGLAYSLSYPVDSSTGNPTIPLKVANYKKIKGTWIADKNGVRDEVRFDSRGENIKTISIPIAHGDWYATAAKKYIYIYQISTGKKVYKISLKTGKMKKIK